MLPSLKYMWKNAFGQKAFFVDNTAFWWFYSFSCILYFFSATILTMRAFLGDAMSCESRRPASMSNQLMEAYCLASGTFTLVDDDRTFEQKINSWCKYDSTDKAWCPPYNNPPKQRKVWNIAPWVGFEQQFHQKKQFHRYYGIVIFYLLYASFLFFLPKLLWSRFENDRITNMCSDLNNYKNNMKTLSEEMDGPRIQKIVSHFAFSGDWHTSYVIKKLCCEALTVIVCAIVYYGTCKLLDNDYWNYGFTVIRYLIDPETYDRRDPQFPDTYPIIWDYFPLITKCSFHTYGYSGTQQRSDVLCVLNYNRISGHLFFVFWINHWICAMLSVGLIIFRVASFSSMRVRYMQMKGRMKFEPKDPHYQLLKLYNYPKFLVLMVVKDHCHVKLYKKLICQLCALAGVDVGDIEECVRIDGVSLAPSTTNETFDSKKFKDAHGIDGSSINTISNAKCFKANESFDSPKWKENFNKLLDDEYGPKSPRSEHVEKIKRCQEINSAKLEKFLDAEYGSNWTLCKEVDDTKPCPEKNPTGLELWLNKPKDFERMNSITSVERSSFLSFEPLRDDAIVDMFANDDKEVPQKEKLV